MRKTSNVDRVVDQHTSKINQFRDELLDTIKLSFDRSMNVFTWSQHNRLSEELQFIDCTKEERRIFQRYLRTIKECITT